MTFAPRSEVVDTVNVATSVIAASKISAPVIPISFNPLVPPTAPSNSIWLAATVKSLAVASLLSKVLAVPENKISELVAVKVTLVVNCTPPAVV